MHKISRYSTVIFAILLIAFLSFLGYPTGIEIQNLYITIIRQVVNSWIWFNVGITLYRVLLSFFLSILISLPLGILMGYNKKIRDIFEGPIELIRSIPVTAFLPLFILVFGIGDSYMIAIAVLGSALIMTINNMYVSSEIDSSTKSMMEVYGMSESYKFKNIIIPHSLKGLFGSFRLGISSCFILIIVAEMFFISKDGLGKLIYDFADLKNTEAMYICIFFTGILGSLMNYILIMVETRIVYWTK